MISSKSKSRPNREELRRQAIAEFLSRNPHHFNGSEALVFIPAYNEEHTIANVVSKVRDACDFDLMVIDDGSNDSTPQILQALEVDVLRHPICLGSGVIVSGLEIGHSLGYKYVIKIDGDDQHNPQDIPRLYEHAVKTGADIVIGSRHLHKFNAKILSIEGLGMWFCSKLVSLLSRKRIPCGGANHCRQKEAHSGGNKHRGAPPRIWRNQIIFDKEANYVPTKSNSEYHKGATFIAELNESCLDTTTF